MGADIQVFYIFHAVPNLIKHGACHADTPSIRQGLDTGGQIHSIAKDIVSPLNHLTKINTDTKKHLSVFRQRLVFHIKMVLDFQRALHRIHHTEKLGKNRITGGVYEAPAMPSDIIGKHLPASGQHANGMGGIFSHEPAVAPDIGNQYGRKFSYFLLVGHAMIF